MCIAALLGAFAFSCYLFSQRNVQDVNVQIIVQVDSTGVVLPESIDQMKDLKAELDRHEQLIEDRYKHVLEQKENMNDMLTIGGMFLTIVLALFGFFGYKSINTLEDKVKADAKGSFEKKFEIYAQATTESLKSQMGKDVKETVGKGMAEYQKTTNKWLEAKITKDFNDKYDDIRAEVDAVSTSLGNLDEKLAVLTSDVDKLAANEKLQERKRRTLAAGGKKV